MHESEIKLFFFKTGYKKYDNRILYRYFLHIDKMMFVYTYHLQNLEIMCADVYAFCSYES